MEKQGRNNKVDNMSEEKIVPIDKGAEDNGKLSIEEQEEVANKLGTEIMLMVRETVKDKGLHPMTASLLMADIAAVFCAPGGHAGVAIYLEALARHCREEAEYQHKSSENTTETEETEETEENSE
jgi:hypothetical protein